ncbi:MAG TPA: ATP-binding protein [Aeromicrobium sp.]|nr:ATP-binding protein [Aeromicrobium sp.]
MRVLSGSSAIGLGPLPTSAAAARGFVRSSLDDLDVPEPPLEDAVLMTSELVTNALLHARGEIEIRLDSDGHRVRIEVRDRNSRVPVFSAVPVDATSGRGLFLVEKLAEDWGVDSRTDGKAVWFEVQVDQAAG